MWRSYCFWLSNKGWINLYNKDTWSYEDGTNTVVRSYGWNEVSGHRGMSNLTSILLVVDTFLNTPELLPVVEKDTRKAFSDFKKYIALFDYENRQEELTGLLNMVENHQHLGLDKSLPIDYKIRVPRALYGAMRESGNSEEEQREKLFQAMSNLKDFVAEVEDRFNRAMADLKVQEDESSDDATLGGIDMDSRHLDLQIKRDGQGVALPVHMQDIPKIQIDGLYPVIINIQPVTTVPLIFSQILEEQGDTQTAGVEDYQQLSYAIEPSQPTRLR